MTLAPWPGEPSKIAACIFVKDQTELPIASAVFPVQVQMDLATKQTLIE